METNRRQVPESVRPPWPIVWLEALGRSGCMWFTPSVWTFEFREIRDGKRGER